MPLAYLLVSLVGAAFTFNAYRPRARQSILIVPSFFAGWLTTELAVHHVVWQAVATVVFIWAGALSGWLGWVGLGVTLLSWAGLAVLALRARDTRDVMEAALANGLGANYGVALSSPAGGAEPPPKARTRLAFALPVGRGRVEVVRNIRYAPGAGRRHCLDVYRPRSMVARAPVVVQVHGGAWVMGNKRQQALPLMHHLAANGWICVAPNYRLSPQATFPDHLVDLKCALGWVRGHIAEFGGDPEFIVVTGGSAGGHLAALLALTSNDAEYQPSFTQVDTSVQACVPFYGVYDFAGRFGGRGADGMGGFIERIVMKKRVAEDPEAFEQASPMSRVHEGAPPFMVVHGTHDSLAPVKGARAFTDSLRSVSRAPVVYAELPGAQHAFEVFHSLRTEHVVEGVARFLNVVHASYQGMSGSTTSPARPGPG
jgi:acetyl esterase/lipase